MAEITHAREERKEFDPADLKLRPNSTNTSIKITLAGVLRPIHYKQIVMYARLRYNLD